MSALNAQGWSRPPISKKYHWFDSGEWQSLCGRYGYAGGEREEGMDDHPDNCAECKKRAAKRKAKKGGTS
jgi:hypothetical protein